MTRINIFDINNLKKEKRKIVAVAAYTYSIAKIIDQYCDIILVGDSLSYSIYGMENTLPISHELMIEHSRAVVNATKNAFVISDLPFGSYEESKEKAFNISARFIKESRCQAIKLEASEQMMSTIDFLSNRSINIVSHIGLSPQNINNLGKYRIIGKNKEEYDQVIKNAIDSEKAGASMLVIEAVTDELANDIVSKVSIPTIGIGASVKCDGQILVIDDILGMNDEFSPKFVKRYDNFHARISDAIKKYQKDVKNKNFPSKDNIY